jgi:hypothetical protein
MMPRSLLWLLPCSLLLVSLMAPAGLGQEPRGEVRDPEAEDPVVEILRDLLSSEAISEADARMVFGAAYLPKLAESRAGQRAGALDEMVKNGEITAEQAAERKDALVEYLVSHQFKVQVLGLSEEEARLQFAVESGRMSAEEAEKRRQTSREQPGMEQHFQRLGVDAGVATRIRHHLTENGFSEEQLKPSLGAMLRMIHGLKESKEDRPGMDARLNSYLTEVGLSSEQVDRVWALAQRVAYGLKRKAQSGEQRTLEQAHKMIEARIRAAVESGRISEESAERRLQAMRQQGADPKEQRHPQRQAH